MISSLKRIALKVGDAHKCPEDHEAKIVWIREDRKVIAVRCPHEHFSKMMRVSDRNKSRTSLGRYPTEEKKVFVRNMVFLISI